MPTKDVCRPVSLVLFDHNRDNARNKDNDYAYDYLEHIVVLLSQVIFSR